MLILGILAGLFALILAYSLLMARRLSFPDAYEPRAVPLDGLPAGDAARIEAWGSSLEAKGFRRIGDFRIDLPLGRPDGITQIEQKRVWLSADATTWASAKRFSVLNPTLEGAARSWRLLGFVSRLPSGGLVTTHTCPAADNSFLRDPESSSAIWPGVEDVDLLLEAHRRHLRDRGATPEASDGDLPAFERASWKRTTELSEAQGYLVRRDGRCHSTLKLALRSSLRGLNPFYLERGRPAAVAARLAATAAAAAVGAILFSSPWAIAALFAAAAVAGCFLFPQSNVISWTAAMIPAHLILDARGAGAGWGWLAGAGAIALILPRLEAGRYRRAAAALARPDAGPPPLSPEARRGWAAGMAGCVLAAAALAVWIRSPKDAWSVLFVALGSLALTGFLAASVAADLVPSLRRAPVKRTLEGLAACAVILLAGVLGGGALAWRDETDSRAAADVVVARLEAHRAATGSYPATLAELGPLPAPRCGWTPAAFTYSVGPDLFLLSWPTGRGRRVAAPPRP